PSWMDQPTRPRLLGTGWALGCKNPPSQKSENFFPSPPVSLFGGGPPPCPPATATSPAALPRRRLFTIFIVTSKFLWEGPARRVRRTPGRSPSSPLTTRDFVTPPLAAFPPLALFRNPGRDDWGRPPPSRCATTRRRWSRNEEAPRTGAPDYVFQNVLQKKHDFYAPQPMTRACLR